MLSRKLLTFRHLHKGAKLSLKRVNNADNSLSVSETLFNVLDKVCITFGAREHPALDIELTDQNFDFLSLIP